MPIDPNQEIAFLLELYRLTDGDPAAQKSMFEIGAAIGLSKEEAGKTAEELIGQGWAEVRTLSGGIGITEDGIEAARQHGGGAGGMAGEFTLGAGAVLDAQGVQDLERLIGEIKAGIAGARTDYARLERLVIDLKSLEIQLLSPGPRTAVVKALLDAVREGLADMGVRQMAERIGRIVG